MWLSGVFTFPRFFAFPHYMMRNRTEWCVGLLATLLDLVLLSVWCIRFVIHFQQQFDEGSSVLFGVGGYCLMRGQVYYLGWGGIVWWGVKYIIGQRELVGGGDLCCLCSYCSNIFDVRVSFGLRVNRPVWVCGFYFLSFLCFPRLTDLGVLAINWWL